MDLNRSDYHGRNRASSFSSVSRNRCTRDPKKQGLLGSIDQGPEVEISALGFGQHVKYCVRDRMDKGDFWEMSGEAVASAAIGYNLMEGREGK